MTVIPMPDRGTPTERVAAEVRAEMSRARIRPAHLPRLIGKSQTYWSRRVNGVAPFDVEDLAALAGLLGCSPAAFFSRVGPHDGPGGDDGGGVVRRQGLEPRTR